MIGQTASHKLEPTSRSARKKPGGPLNVPSVYRYILTSACFLSRNERPTSSAPYTIANQPMAKAMPSAPAPGNIKISTPNKTDKTPVAINHHSPSISLRSLMAPTISNTPAAIAHPAMK